MNFKKLLSYAALIAAVALSTGLPVWASYIVPDGSITKAKFSGGAVSQAMLQTRATGTSVAAGGYATSASTGAFSGTNTSLTDVTNATVTIVATGRPVWVGLISDGTINTSASCSVGAFKNSANAGSAESSFAIVRDSTVISYSRVSHTVSTGSTGSGLFVKTPCGAVYMIDTPTAGSHVYKLQYVSATGMTSTVEYSLLAAYEL